MSGSSGSSGGPCPGVSGGFPGSSGWPGSSGLPGSPDWPGSSGFVAIETLQVSSGEPLGESTADETGT